jgi:NhaC family Na+:H+ antiporter
MRLTVNESAEQPQPRKPSLLDALIPVIALVVLIALSVYLFGVDATEGPLQVALLLSASVAALVAHKNGHTYLKIGEAAISGITTAMGAIFILLAVGALIGTWNMAGTIPTVVYIGIEFLNAAWFYLATAAICGLVGAVTGSSWTTAGTLGVAFVGMAPVMGVSPEITAGAVISGAYFGDKMTPLSETTIMVPQLVGGLNVYQHIRAMLWTSLPAFLIALVIFGIIGLTGTAAETQAQKDAALQAIEAVYNISWINLLPLLLLLVLTIVKLPPFLSIFMSALFAGVLAVFTQPQVVQSVANDPSLSAPLAAIKANYSAMAFGHVSTSAYPAIDELFSRGGMQSMLTTIWLILGALSFAAIMEHAGFLDRFITPVVGKAKSTGTLIIAVIGTGFGLNVIAGDQYVAVVLPSRMFRLEFKKRGLAPQVLSRAVEDSGTVTSVLVPWNTCGAYIAGVLGVSTFAYVPYCFYNILNPIISLIYGFTGFKIERLPTAPEAPAAEA